MQHLGTMVLSLSVWLLQVVLVSTSSSMIPATPPAALLLPHNRHLIASAHWLNNCYHTSCIIATTPAALLQPHTRHRIATTHQLDNYHTPAA
jgi:hypothetical protein